MFNRYAELNGDGEIFVSAVFTVNFFGQKPFGLPKIQILGPDQYFGRPNKREK